MAVGLWAIEVLMMRAETAAAAKSRYAAAFRSRLPAAAGAPPWLLTPML